MSSKLSNSRQLRIKGVRSNTVRHGDRSTRQVADRRLSGMAEIAVTECIAKIESVSGGLDENGWPVGFFERVAGSMPELERAPGGQFEERLPLE